MSGLAGILTAAAPIFSVIVASVWLKDEPVTRPRLFGAVLGLIGVAILIGPKALVGLDVNLLAQVAVLGAALTCAFAGVYARIIARVALKIFYRYQQKSRRDACFNFYLGLLAYVKTLTLVW